MSASDESVAAREFVASSEAYTPGWEKLTDSRAAKYWWAGFVGIIVVVVVAQQGPAWGLHLPLPHVDPTVGLYAFFGATMAFTVAVGGYLLWCSRRKFLITATSKGITIDRRRKEFYSFDEAHLGLWATKGVALHLSCGRRSFLLGGRDRRIDPTTPLDASPVQLVDAWLPDSDFDELLALNVRWRPAVARGEETRCLLYPNPLLIQSMGPFAVVKKQRLMHSLAQPRLFVDVGDDEIRVIDAQTNSVNAAGPPSQVTATVATYQLGGEHAFPTLQNVASDAAGQYLSTMPVITIRVPGGQPLAIGCRDFTDLKLRFSWQGGVPVSNDPPPYVVSATDWLTLTKKCGLSKYVKDTAQ
jgi:hypothetical protein